MQLLLNALAIAVPVLYAITAAGYGIVFFRDGRRAVSSTLQILLPVSAASHAVYLTLLIIDLGHIPVSTIFDSLSVISLALVLVYLLVEKIVLTQATGVFILGLTALFQAVSSVFARHGSAENPVLSNPLFGIHAGAAILGYAGFALAAVFGVLYMLLCRELKQSKPGFFADRLPPLVTLARMHEAAIVTGLIAFTLALLHGFIWLPRVYGWVLTDPMVIRSIVIWLMYTGIVIAHYTGRGKRTHLISLSIATFVLLLLSSIALNTLLSSFHDFS